MRFALWSAAFFAGCMAAPILPTHPLIVRRELTEVRIAGRMVKCGYAKPLIARADDNVIRLFEACLIKTDGWYRMMYAYRILYLGYELLTCTGPDLGMCWIVDTGEREFTQSVQTYAMLISLEQCQPSELCAYPTDDIEIQTNPVHINACFHHQKEKRENDEPLTSDGDVDPVNDGEVNNNISLIRLC
ncbi:uncharacterized protein BO97DRAFT_418629 [Aspergillus homomorphus CBS 101889]|uniref:LysM domain-containing protein n=1 Tax=Aspergillus homomorphus (strain CBS 101889) TaxID=1450537 RepID=A0A395HK82_ASPHC|nr:hypothetical protein BO97DRAFT_418629 [Aspergillus homomorphus CBS 101889]RAL07338.1 hypothetical protein BO97DRAFT_418629 [Aspergillus homomorphus CBS 101889]